MCVCVYAFANDDDDTLHFSALLWSARDSHTRWDDDGFISFRMCWCVCVCLHIVRCRAHGFWYTLAAGVHTHMRIDVAVCVCVYVCVFDARTIDNATSWVSLPHHRSAACQNQRTKCETSNLRPYKIRFFENQKVQYTCFLGNYNKLSITKIITLQHNHMLPLNNKILRKIWPKQTKNTEETRVIKVYFSVLHVLHVQRTRSHTQC